MKKFEASFKSLRNYECPEWFQDAKFGIWSHWGPQAVAGRGDWYARKMYREGSDEYKYHLEHYGHPSEFGYKDLVELWKAEKFDPDALMEKYYKAGARYFVAQASHHDHFFNYDSDLNPMNSTKVGPMKDICGMWKAAAKKYDLPFGMTEHIAASFSWWKSNKGHDSEGPYKDVPYDGNDPKFRDYYFDNYEHYKKPLTGNEDYDLPDWYTENETFHQYWYDVMKEIVDKYEPELLYSDGGLPFGKTILDETITEFNDNDPLYQKGLDAVSYFYNHSIEKFGENRYVYNQKDRREAAYKIGVLDIERSQLSTIRKYPWQTDTCIGSWFYHSEGKYKSPAHIIELLVDIISKNGTLLLNIIQLPDGSINAEAEHILDELAKWYAICGEAVYGTRPFTVSGEGNNSVDTTEVFSDGDEQVKLYFKEEAVEWDATDVRFTKKGDVVYAFLMNAGASIDIKSLSDNQVKGVTLLGYGEVEFSQENGVLSVVLPEQLPTEYTNCLAIKC